MRLIADNLRITKPEIQRALKEKNSSIIQNLVKQYLEYGAWAIDVNTGPLGRSPEDGMTFFIEAVQQATDLPLLIDTSNPAAMRQGLKVARNRAIINGFSLEPKKIEKILPMAKEFDADIVGFLLYPDSRVPKDVQQRLEIAMVLFEEAESAGVPKEKIIIDPVVPPLAWEDGIVQARDVLTVVRTLPDLMGFPVRTIAGISNLATGAGNGARKKQVTQSYLSMLAAAGLTYALIDILDVDLIRTATTASILTSQSLFAWELIPD